MKFFIFIFLILATFSPFFFVSGLFYEQFIQIEGTQLTYPEEGFYLLMLNRKTGKFEYYFIPGHGFYFFELNEIHNRYPRLPLNMAQRDYPIYNLDELHYDEK
jgi:hypothetical protein